MQPALAVGTLLQNRYRIVRLLGQGGFGRTYLTKDQGRFEEGCVIKEFMPPAGSDRFSSKAAQLFQREAEILYQISHPQIPQFRATFEQDQRLFLVQDHIEGLTYREILQQRPGQAFSETEIRAFLGQLLPVLAHIHAKGIIHRDISPDNIILRRSDQKPVLIDFGVVKEVVTRLQTGATVAQATTVGKAGYAPSEQLQSGRAYPSSDLYALAVTVLVLMTGKEPHELFDDANLSWNWRPLVQVSEQLATVLNKALNYRPSDRYQSVSEMVRALQDGVTAPRPPQGSAVPKPSSTPISEMRTVAVGRPVATASGQARQNTSPVSRTRVVTSAKPQKPMDNPLVLAAMFLGAALLAAFGGWAVVRYVLKPSPPELSGGQVQPLPFPEDLENPDESPTQTPPQEPEPLEPSDDGLADYTTTLALVEGDQQTVEGGIKRGETVNYQVDGKSGQTLQATIEGKGVVFSVLDADGKALRGGRQILDWEGDLPDDGLYTVQVQTTRGTEQGTYELELALAGSVADANDGVNDTDGTDGNESLPGTEVPEEVDGSDDGASDGDQPSPDDEADVDETEIQEQISTQRVQFTEGETGTLLANSVGPGRVQRYVINAKQGQIMTVKTIQATGPVTFDVSFPGGDVEAEGVSYWNSFLPLGGDYAIDVRAINAAEFKLDVQVVGQNSENP